jgi:hypothetical protein
MSAININLCRPESTLLPASLESGLHDASLAKWHGQVASPQQRVEHQHVSRLYMLRPVRHMSWVRQVCVAVLRSIERQTEQVRETFLLPLRAVVHAPLVASNRPHLLNQLRKTAHT